MNLLGLVLVLASLLCGLTAGFLFAFASVVMPGLAKLNDAAYIRAFQVIDGVIQAGQVLFRVVWVGSVLVVSMAVILALLQGDSIVQVLVVAAAMVYFLGVQLPNFGVNVPLNNRLQALDVEAMGEVALASARRTFEQRWLRWNLARTVLATVTSLLLMLALLRL